MFYWGVGSYLGMVVDQGLAISGEEKAIGAQNNSVLRTGYRPPQTLGVGSMKKMTKSLHGHDDTPGGKA